MGVLLGKILFKHRGWLGVPFFALALLLARPSALFWVGALLTLAGEAVRALAAAQAGPTTRSRDLEAPRLVTEGLYAWCRNPIYWGNFLIGLGMTLSSGILWLAALFVPLFWIEYYLIVLAEEEFLRERFGKEYEEYCRRARRFLPVPRKTKFELKGPGAIIRQERGTLLVIFGYYALLGLRLYLATP